jgi:hypothetical protein
MLLNSPNGTSTKDTLHGTDIAHRFSTCGLRRASGPRKNWDCRNTSIMKKTNKKYINRVQKCKDMWDKSSKPTIPIYFFLILSIYSTAHYNCFALKSSGNYMYHLLQQSVTVHFAFMGFIWFSLYTAIISLNSVNRLIFLMVKICVFFAVRTKCLIT